MPAILQYVHGSSGNDGNTRSTTCFVAGLLRQVERRDGCVICTCLIADHRAGHLIIFESNGKGLGRDGEAEEVEEENKEVGASEDESPEGSEQEGRQTPKIPGIPKEPTEGETGARSVAHTAPIMVPALRQRQREEPTAQE